MRWGAVSAIVLTAAALATLPPAGPALAGEPTEAVALQQQLREAMPDARLELDCFLARHGHCEDAAQQADEAGDDTFDHDVCLATPRPMIDPLPTTCRFDGDLDGDGKDDLVLTVHRRNDASGEAARGLVVLEADGDVTLFGAGVSAELPMFFDDPEPDETFTLGPDLDWLVAAAVLTHVAEPDMPSACAQLVPQRRAGVRLSGTDAAVLLVQGDEGGWRLVHCGM